MSTIIMDEESQEDKPLTSYFKRSRHRSPAFSTQEAKLLVTLIEQYQLYLLNKSVTSSANQVKEIAWKKVAKAFNSHNIGPHRSADGLKTKWENLKRGARRLSKDMIEAKPNEFNEIFDQVVTMLSAADNMGSVDNPPQLEADDDSDNGLEEEKNTTNNCEAYWDESVEKMSEDEGEGQDNEIDTSQSFRINRSMNFSPDECSLLLQCVRQEKKHVFSKDVTGRANELKTRAWIRITNSYNKLSPQKRSTKVLRTKFCNMKNLAKKVGFNNYIKKFGHKNEKLLNGSSNKKIKKEPKFEYKTDNDSEDNEEGSDHEFTNPDPVRSFVNVTPPDPLSAVLNGDSIIGSTNTGSLGNQLENKEIVKLKLELLNYQMETAKLDRKRIEEACKGEASARDARELEAALRLRAARLDARAAEAKFPPTHPALHYPPAELRAHQYLTSVPD